MNENNKNWPTIHKVLTLDKSLGKMNFKKSFSMTHSTLDRQFLIPLTTSYHEYMDRPKLIEQKARLGI